jgi:hypothetical protein
VLWAIYFLEFGAVLDSNIFSVNPASVDRDVIGAVYLPVRSTRACARCVGMRSERQSSRYEGG